MCSYTVWIISCLLSLLFMSARNHVDALNINTTSGELKGVFLDSINITKYLGIPYAEAPVGELRFKPPVRKGRMDGVYNANSNSFICPQPYRFINGWNRVEQTEDCLRLDVFVPRPGNKANPLPVIVSVHGGAYVSGDSTVYESGSARLAAEGQVIVVNLNYRLGILGFLNTMDENSMGNFGLLDQCSAIEWVVDNIVHFGGNASQITIFGQSAGASSVMQLAMSTLCVGKFQRVIALSGSPDAIWAHNRDPRMTAQKLASVSGCPSQSEGFVNCLKNHTWEEINGFQRTLFSLQRSDWAPHYSTDIFPDNPLEIIKGRGSVGLRNFQSLDFLSGVCNEEGEFIYSVKVSGLGGLSGRIKTNDATLSTAEFHRLLEETLVEHLQLASTEITELFPVVTFHFTDWKNRNDIFTNARGLVEFYSDVTFNLGAIRSANVHGSKSDVINRTLGSPYPRGSTFFYQFKPRPPLTSGGTWNPGATHGGDLLFVSEIVQAFGTDQSKRLAHNMFTYWSNFAKSGSPNEPVPVDVMWPEYDSRFGRYIKLDLTLTTDTFPYARRYAFWDKYFFPRLQRLRENIIFSSGISVQISLGTKICLVVSLLFSLFS